MKLPVRALRRSVHNLTCTLALAHSSLRFPSNSSSLEARTLVTKIDMTLSPTSKPKVALHARPTPTVVNNYIPEPKIQEGDLYGPEPYDVNFVLPIPPVLSTDKLRLVPFVPRIHATTFLDGVRGHESMFKYLPNVLEHPTDFLRFVEMRRRDKSAFLFAVIDTTRPDPNHPEWKGSLAGLYGLQETDQKNLVVKIGPGFILPAFQRTHVNSHAMCLSLKYILELPPSGLGFRKAKASASPFNVPSNKVLERMGLKLEGVLRWKNTIPLVEGYEKVGKESRVGDAGNGLLGSDVNEWAMCWDDWEESGREIVERALARVEHTAKL